MERKRYILIIAILTGLTTILNASYRTEVYSAFVNNNMPEWKNVIDRMDNSGIKSDDFLLELVNYQYGYIAWCLGNKRSDEARHYLAKAELNLDILSGNKQNQSSVEAYKSAFYGFRIAMNKISAPFLGPKSMDYARRSVASNKENPLGYIQLGNIQFYMPKQFGGSKKEGLDYFLTALRLMERNISETDSNWNYLSLLTIIAQSYYYTNELDKSLEYINIILKMEPGYGWIKTDLYPRVMKKFNELKKGNG